MAIVPVPVDFRKSSPLQISFNWSDLAAGVGYITYYATSVEDSSGQEYILTPNILEGWFTGRAATGGGVFESGRESRGSMTGASATQVFDLTFESTTFTVPRTLRGDMIVNIPFGYRPADSATNPTCYCIVTVYKDSTQIGQNTSATHSIETGDSTSTGMMSFKVNISETTINTGQQLKINVDFYGISSAGKQAGFIIGYDPLDREIPQVEAGGTVAEQCDITSTTKMTFHVPFKIDQ